MSGKGILLFVVPFLTACSLPAANSAGTYLKDSETVYVSKGDKSELLEKKTNVGIYENRSRAISDSLVQIDEGSPKQTVDSFGAALTHSSAYQLMLDKKGDVRHRILEDLFTPKGANLNTIRIPIGASDFISEPHFFTCCDNEGENGDELSHFTLDHDQALMAVVKEIIALRGDLKILATAWSAPAWMKEGNVTSDEDPSGYALCGGSLRNDCVSLYADYLVRFVEEYKKAGIVIDCLSLVNEPLVKGTQYPSMSLSSEAAVKVTIALEGKLPEGVYLLAYDHNCEDAMYDYLGTLFRTNRIQEDYSGIAVHGYGSESLSTGATRLKEAYPDKPVYLTEITEWEHGSSFWDDLFYCVSHTTIEGVAGGLSGVLYWNLVLTKTGEPNLGQKSICYGLVDLDYDADGNAAVEKHAAYYALAHLSKSLTTGKEKKAICYPTYSDDEAILTVSMKDETDHFETVLANQSEETKNITLQKGDWSLRFAMEGESLMSIVF